MKWLKMYGDSVLKPIVDCHQQANFCLGFTVIQLDFIIS